MYTDAHNIICVTMTRKFHNITYQKNDIITNSPLGGDALMLLI